VEKTSVIVTLGNWVLDHACKQMSAWRDAGIAPPILAVNLSLKQLQTGEELFGGIVQTFDLLARFRGNAIALSALPLAARRTRRRAPYPSRPVDGSGGGGR